MCGIFCAISENKQNNVECHLHSALQKLLQNRGPDLQHQLIIDNILLAGNVLWQQGEAPQRQPIVAGDLALLFNGDLFNLSEEKAKNQADSAWLMAELIKCKDEEQLLLLLQRLQGPYCLLLYNRLQKILYFCRDALGRNSLIIEREAETEAGATQCIKLLSTSCHTAKQATTTQALELPPLGLYKLQLAELDKCVLYPWQQLSQETRKQLHLLDAAMQWQTQVAEPIEPDWLCNVPHGAVTYDLYELVGKKDANNELQLESLLQHEAVAQTLQRFHELMKQSVAARILHTAPVCRHCVATSCEHAKICILFSGGIDCSILALLADKFVPQTEPIELINVAFERVASVGNVTNATADPWAVPDRQTAWQSLEELRRLCPKRLWQLLEVNVSRKELQQELQRHICHLIYPLQTVLDECLGSAFWFAAASPNSKARVALLGSGADELFGGYTRHRNAHRRGGPEALQQELEHDWQRIPARNLARDDRIIADCGKTARAPFIEEHVAGFIRSLAPQQRCCYALPEGLGDKLLLRLYGHTLGLRNAVLLKKRAIQFGSRVADKKQQAAQKSEYLCFESLQIN